MKYRIVKLYEARAPHDRPFVIEKKSFFGFYYRANIPDGFFKTVAEAEKYIKSYLGFKPTIVKESYI